MIKVRLFSWITCMIIGLQGCSILEPVSLNYVTSSSEATQVQEDLPINLKALTFKNASKANKNPYPRQIMMNKSGLGANVFNEMDFLNIKIPDTTKNASYTLGFGDNLVFRHIQEFSNESPVWPASIDIKDYLIGVGDELTLIQQTKQGYKEVLEQEDPSKNLSIIETKGTVGSNGEILLIGIGNLIANGKALNEMRNDIRNILIRIGVAPNFQLEISKFNSKRIYVSHTSEGSKIIPIDYIPISLKEVVLGLNVTQADENSVLITLTRDNVSYRFTAGQLFDASAPIVMLKDNDEIEIDLLLQNSNEIKTTVGLNGNILIPDIGSLYVLNQTMDVVQKKLETILIEKGYNPIFQLEIIGFNSKKAYFVSKESGTSIIKLTNTKTSLKQIILSRNLKVPNNTLPIVTLKRKKEKYHLTLDNLYDAKTPEIWINNQDQIEVDFYPYKPGQVYALSGAGQAIIVPIEPSRRETLANVLFSKGGALSNLSSKRSEIYLIRGKKPTIAYHLDAQNVSRILVAAKTELRPNDIIYSADRSIISFNRALAEIAPLRALMRDIDQDNIP
jgi:polysaccharide biosynthesis/export protein